MGLADGTQLDRHWSGALQALTTAVSSAARSSMSALFAKRMKRTWRPGRST